MEDNLTPEQMAKSINDRLDKTVSKADLESLRTEIATLNEKGLVTKEDFDKLDGDMQKMSETLNKLTENKEVQRTTLRQAIKEQIDANKTKSNAEKQIDMVLKVDNLFNIQVITGGSFDGDEANLDALLLSESAIETGFAPDLRRELTLLNEMRNATPLRIGDGLKWIEPEDQNGVPLTVNEANLKPIGTVKYARKSKESDKIAIYFQIAEEFLNRADFLMTEVNNHFRSLLTEELEEKVFTVADGVMSYATPFVVPVGYTVVEANRLDAINAVATSMKLLKYKPSHVVLNSADVSMMFATKGLDGHYSLSNGDSIRLINNGQTLVIGTNQLRIIEVNSDLLAIGSVAVIDWAKLKFGLGVVRLKSDPYTNMRQNILNFLMEAPFCVARPSNYPYAVVSSPFETIITEITPT